MLADSERIVIVGASLAGYSAAKELRRSSFGGEIVLLGEEDHLPYSRPQLSKGYLDGSYEREWLFRQDTEWYAQQNIALRLGVKVGGIEPRSKVVVLNSGEVVAYDRLLLTTGCSPRMIDVPGTDLDGVFTVRTIDDCEALRDRIGAGTANVVVIGTGWLGMEIAATARTLGNDVTMLGRSSPLVSLVGSGVSAALLELHREHGVEVRIGFEVSQILSCCGDSDYPCDGATSNAPRRVVAVELTTGETIEATVVVVAVGARPNDEIAASAGLRTRNGIVVDSSLRTSDPSIWAAGGVANVFHANVGCHVRADHWASAVDQGPAAASSMMGDEVSYSEAPYLYSDQYESSIELFGYQPLMRDATFLCRGDVMGGEFIGFWLRNQRIVGAMSFNVWDVGGEMLGIVERTSAPDLTKLIDPSISLDYLQ